MPGQFSVVWPKRRGPSDPWFRIGTLDVTTATAVAALSLVSFFVYAADKTLLRWVAFLPPDVAHGEVWRLITWPLLNQPDIWTVFSVFLLWWFGNQLEGDFGRVRFTKFILAVALVPAILTTGYYYLSGGLTISNLDSLGVINSRAITLVELGVFVAFIAEHASAKFFFGIPAWVMGAVIIAVDVLRYLGDRLFLALVFELVMAGSALLLVRAFGFGHDVPWVPLVRLPKFLVSDGSGKTTGKPRPTAAGRTRTVKKAKRSTAPTVGPWPGSTGGPVNSTQHDVDRILDKIASSGMASLTPEERAQLEAASRARRDKKA
jgi:membrane associated rhomboid family serine protease